VGLNIANCQLPIVDCSQITNRMTTKEAARDFHVQFDEGGALARRKTELLPNGLYLFEDEVSVNGVIRASVITCAAWLLELYELRSGEVFFISGKEQISPKTKRFGVLYPRFSITQPSFKNVESHVFGIAAIDALPEEFTGAPIVFDANRVERPTNLQQIIEILKTSVNRQPIELNPQPSLVSLKAKRLIDESHRVYPSIARVASRIGVTHAHLSRQFKRDFEMSPSAYLRQLRVADVPFRLARGEEIINVSLDVGYNDLSRFYKQFRKTTKTSPGVCKTMMRPRQ
jgi:AraC-like DNA-binding protein